VVLWCLGLGSILTGILALWFWNMAAQGIEIESASWLVLAFGVCSISDIAALLFLRWFWQRRTL